MSDAPTRPCPESESALLPCPICRAEGQTLLRGICYDGSIDKKGAVMCPACGCRASLKSWQSRAAGVCLESAETCHVCMGSGYSNHPDSGQVCHACEGQGGVCSRAPAQASQEPTRTQIVQAFETIRIKLINCLEEPERSAFWLAVQMRDALSLSSTHVPAQKVPDCGDVPEREAFWLLERHDGKAWALYTSHSGAFVHSYTEDVWRAGRFLTQRHAHDVWRSLEKSERERWKPVEHMFVNKVQDTSALPSTD